MSDIHERRLGEAVERLKSAGGRRGRWQDLRRDEGERTCARSSTQAIATLGGVDVLVNNAGLGGSASVVEMTDEQWHKVLDVSLTSVFRMTPRDPAAHVCARQRRDRQQRVRARLARAGAAVALRRGQGRRHGLHALLRRSRPRSTRVRINAVAPSIAMHEFLNRVTQRRAARPSSRRREAFGRTAETWEVANVIVFLASDLASYMTGEVVSVSSQRA